MKRLHLLLVTVTLIALASDITVPAAQRPVGNLCASLASESRKTSAGGGAASNQGGSITGEVYVRERENGDDSLLLALGSAKDPAKDDRPVSKIDEARVKLPINVNFNLGYAPPGWQLKQDKKNLVLNGPPGYLVNIRLDAKDTGKDDLARQFEKKKVDVEAFSGGKSVFDQNLTVTPLPKVEVANNLDGKLNLPNRISPGEKLLASLAENFSPMPKERVFFNYNYYNSGVRNITVEGKGSNPPEQFRGDFNGALKEDRPWFPATWESVPKNQDPLVLNYFSNFIASGGFVVRTPEGAKPGDKLHFTFIDPWGELIVDATANQTEIVPPRDTTCPPTLNGSAPQVFAGQTLCICACVHDPLTWFQMMFDGQPILPAAASTSTVILRIPDSAAPGRHSVTLNPKVKDASGKVDFLVLKLVGSIDQNKLWTGQSTKMNLQVVGTEDKMPLEIENKTPDVITVDGGVKQVINTSGGPANTIERGVKGIMRGNFKIDYKLALPPCPCPEKEVKTN